MTKDEFLKKAEESLEEACNYDFREEVFQFEEEDTCEFAQYIAYKGTPGKEADTCDLLKDIWEMLFQDLDFNPLNACMDDKGFHGDTMNSVQTTLNQLFIELAEGVGLTLLKGRYKWSFNACKNADKAKVKKVLDDPVAGEVRGFLKVSYTIGNFIPCPTGCNRPATSVTKDYWDLTLYYIYCWYHDTPERRDCHLEKLFWGDQCQDQHIENYKVWLRYFRSWDAFIEANYLQDYTEWSTKPHGRPKEFWDGHFSGLALPQTKEQIEAFFERATECIQARSKRIVAALQNLQEKPGE